LLRTWLLRFLRHPNHEYALPPGSPRGAGSSGGLRPPFSPGLLAEAKAVLGPDFEDEAADVLQDFFLSLVEGRSRFAPERGRALPWMFGIVRAIAAKTRADRAADWGIDEDPA
jgi:Sigma-70 region 2